MVVGHSAAATLAWMIAGQRPDAIDGVVLIGGFPSANGDVYADFFPSVDGVMAFPGWDPFEGPDSADLSAAERERIASAAVPVPESVSQAVVWLADDRRFEVPELSRATRVDFEDIDSGHWPMVTGPLSSPGSSTPQPLGKADRAPAKLTDLVRARAI